MSVLGNKVVKWFYSGNETHCEIKQSKEETLATGVIVRYAKDKPNKRLGRDLAFKKAMKQTVELETITKEDRAQIWNDYRSKINQPV